jgi:vacuolar-type H+-ATPase subunit I/STV1
MKRSTIFSCLLAASVVLGSSSADAQRKVGSPETSQTGGTIWLENSKRLDEVELLLKKIDAEQVLLEEDVKNLEKALLGYIEGIDKAYTAMRGAAQAAATVRELKMFEDKLKALEAQLRRIDAIHTAVADKVRSADIKLDEAWLNKMSKEQSAGYYRSLHPEGRQKVKKVYPELEIAP